MWTKYHGSVSLSQGKTQEHSFVRLTRGQSIFFLLWKYFVHKQTLLLCLLTWGLFVLLASDGECISWCSSPPNQDNAHNPTLGVPYSVVGMDSDKATARRNYGQGKILVILPRCPICSPSCLSDRCWTTSRSRSLLTSWRKDRTHIRSLRRSSIMRTRIVMATSPTRSSQDPNMMNSELTEPLHPSSPLPHYHSPSSVVPEEF